MCGRYTLFSPMESLAELFALQWVAADPMGLLGPRYNIAPTQQIAVIRDVAAGGRGLDLLRWGLVPPWKESPGAGPLTINARAETLAQRPMFRAAFAKRRALIPANGFYEWRKEPGGKQPFYLTAPDGSPLAFAAIWERWRSPKNGEDSELLSCAIITTAANATLRAIHPRMPALLAATDWATWLDPQTPPQQLAPLLRPAPEALLVARPVSRRVNRVQHDDPGLIDTQHAETPPADEGDDPQLPLFKR